MSHFDIINKALRELRKNRHVVKQVEYSLPTEDRLLSDPRVGMLELSPYTEKVKHSVFGISVQIDPSMPDGEIRLKDSTGQVLQTVNIGTG